MPRRKKEEPIDDPDFDPEMIEITAFNQSTCWLAQLRPDDEIRILLKRKFPHLSNDQRNDALRKAREHIYSFTAERNTIISNNLVQSYLNELKDPDQEVRDHARKALREMLALDEASKNMPQTSVSVLINSVTDEQATEFLRAHGWVKAPKQIASESTVTQGVPKVAENVPVP